MICYKRSRNLHEEKTHFCKLGQQPATLITRKTRYRYLQKKKKKNQIRKIALVLYMFPQTKSPFLNIYVIIVMAITLDYVEEQELTVIGSSMSSVPTLFTNISPYSPMHHTATRTRTS